MKIFALVDMYNDEKHIEESLAFLKSFDEWVVVDFSFSDRLVEFAQRFEIKVFQPKNGFKVFTVEFEGDNFVAHYWIDSYSQLFSKHERYLKMEGRARFIRGERFSWKKLFGHTWENFKASLVHKSGWRGGWVGWFLSFFYAQYEARGWLALRQYENSQKRGQS